jgi:rubrerythrin
LPQTKEQLIAGLREAILAEQTGVEFYAAAAERTTDERGREVFRMLGREEAEHQAFLSRQYGHVMKDEAVEALDPSHRVDLSRPSPIFSEKLKARIGEAHWEMTALSVGLAIEDASIARYRGLARVAEAEAVRLFFEELARWEEGHAEALRRQQNELRESYWESAHFAPF